MKKIMLIGMIYIMALSNITYAFANTTEIEEPKVDAQGAVLMDFKTGRVLWEKNAHEPLAMASTTKIMTAIVALENGNLNDIVTVSQKAALTPPVKMSLTKDEKISLKALLYALMLQSSNDAATAIAEHIGGSVEEFCKMMTEKAKSLGAENTVFETPNGLDAGDHHSTAYDMAVISRYALQNEDFIYIINTRNISFTSDKRSYDIYNKNRLLNEFNGATGIKTGYTGKAGHCFVGAARQNNMQLISVVLASGWGAKGKEQKWVDTKAILNYGFKTFEYEQLFEKGENGGDIDIVRSKKDNLGVCFSEGLLLPLSKKELENVRIDIELPDQMQAPIDQGDKIGEATIYVEDKLYSKIDLISTGYVTRFDLKTCAEAVLNAFAKMGTKNDTMITLPESGIWK